MTAPLDVPIRQFSHADGLPLPAYETEGAAGMDLRAAVPENDAITLEPGAFATIPTGLAIALPPGTEAQVRPRSGLAARHGVTLLNAPGTVDCDYRGEIKVILINHGPKPFDVTRGLRIAQLVIAAYIPARFTLATELDDTVRGAAGFGSTGST